MDETPEDRHRRHSRESYHRHREKRLAQMKQWRTENHEQALAIQRRWFSENRDASNAKRRQYHADHREEALGKFRQWYADHAEQERPKHRAWHHANKEKANAKRSAQYREFADANPEAVKEQSKMQAKRARQNGPWVKLILSAKARAEKKGVPFSLTAEWGAARWTGKCEITRLDFNMALPGKPGPKCFSPSIDRIVPQLGYTPENCRFVLWAVNAFKGDADDAVMFFIADAIVKSPLFSRA